MNISVRWLTHYLSAPACTPEEAELTLMSLGFPSESRTQLSDGDSVLDLEVTSNRGDVLSHLGAAREIAARTGRTLMLPTITSSQPDSTPATSLIRVENQTPEVCPLFTARVIRGVRVGPSPEWLRVALESVGQCSISNVVDVTNFITMEFGNPCHVFDLHKIEGGTLIIRYARDKEPLLTLDGKRRTLAADDLVVADARGATSLAGVIGGADSEVGASTSDIVLEMATWDPVTVRRASRRHAVRTDASHRFERIVDARTIHTAAERAAALIAEVSGGRVCAGSVEAGVPLAPVTTIRLRPERCAELLGVGIGADEIVRHLTPLGIGIVQRSGEPLQCTIPAWRPDLTREVDLIEEVVRVRGLDTITVSETLPVAVRPPQATETARREIASVLTGLHFFEAVTFSFTTRDTARALLPMGMSLIEINDERRKGEPVCRPSVLAGLLACRRANQHAQVRPDGGVRLYEVAAVFGQTAAGTTAESLQLALLMDVPIKGKVARVEELQVGVNTMRGVIEAVVRAVAGTGQPLEVAPASPHCSGLDPRAYATVTFNASALGYYGLIAADVTAGHDLSWPVIGAELNLPVLLGAYPPRTAVVLPPAFPGIERDVSFVLPETVRWDVLRAEVARHAQPPMDGATFVGTFRGPQVGKSRKSVTIRMHFRDPHRTLRHEEVDAPVAALVDRVKAALGAEVRA
ncbi:MAG: phenylalanine--tRNA ligase subunit beta [Phycisphaerae bacterium]|nr:phenylalanine--tRNA ligase subunit beta [Phycisphaerae bacterium]